MTGFWDLHLIHLFDFYLAAMLLFSVSLRLRQYRTILGLVRQAPGRWPRLFRLLQQQHGVFLTWETIAPGVLYVLLALIHTLACRLVWPQARMTPELLLSSWIATAVVLVFGAAMLAFDLYTLFRVAEIDRPFLEKHFNQAEYWLGHWAAPVLSLITFGRLDPRQMVAVEVRKALEELNRMLHLTLWWVCAQTGLRFAYGLSLWLAYVWLHPPHA